jgi:hypothetical protein
MRALEMLDRALESWFLRIYAKNLKKSYRNEPENACTDAEIQLSTMLLMVIGIVFLILGAIFFPIYLRKFFSGGDGMYIGVIALGIAVVYGVHKRFGGYVLKTESARRYVSSRNSRGSLIIYWLVMIGSIVIIWAVFWHRES